MNTVQIVVLVLVVAVAGIGAYFYLGGGDGMRTYRTSGGEVSFTDTRGGNANLLETNEDITCTWAYSVSSDGQTMSAQTTAYMLGGESMARSDMAVTMNGTASEYHAIYDGTYIHMWGSGEENFAMSQTAVAAGAGETNGEKLQRVAGSYPMGPIECERWNADMSVFTKPTNLQFMTI